MAFRGNTKVNGSRLILYQLKKDGLLGKFHSRNQTTRVATNQEFKGYSRLKGNGLGRETPVF